MSFAGLRLLTLEGKDGFSLSDPSTQEPRGFQNGFLSELLEPGPKGPCGPPFPFPPPFHMRRGCIQMAGPLFANQVPDDLAVRSPSLQFVMEAQSSCGRSQELTLLGPSVHVLARASVSSRPGSSPAKLAATMWQIVCG